MRRVQSPVRGWDMGEYDTTIVLKGKKNVCSYLLHALDSWFILDTFLLPPGRGIQFPCYLNTFATRKLTASAYVFYVTVKENIATEIEGYFEKCKIYRRLWPHQYFLPENVISLNICRLYQSTLIDILTMVNMSQKSEYGMECRNNARIVNFDITITMTCSFQKDR